MSTLWPAEIFIITFPELPTTLASGRVSLSPDWWRAPQGGSMKLIEAWCVWACACACACVCYLSVWVTPQTSPRGHGWPNAVVSLANAAVTPSACVCVCSWGISASLLKHNCLRLAWRRPDSVWSCRNSVYTSCPEEWAHSQLIYLKRNVSFCHLFRPPRKFIPRCECFRSVIPAWCGGFVVM